MDKQIPFIDETFDPDLFSADEPEAGPEPPSDDDDDLSFWSNMIFPI